MYPGKCIGTFVSAFVVFTILTLATAIGPVPASDYHNPAIPGKDNPAYWLDRGAMLATYGNFPAAVKAFDQVLKMDPRSSEAYFDLGLAYMELGRSDQALNAIDQALQIDPGKGIYLYGRARVLLMTGQNEKSMADFKAAAEAGVPEALQYLAH